MIGKKRDNVLSEEINNGNMFSILFTAKILVKETRVNTSRSDTHISTSILQMSYVTAINAYNFSLSDKHVGKIIIFSLMGLPSSPTLYMVNLKGYSEIL